MSKPLAVVPLPIRLPVTTWPLTEPVLVGGNTAGVDGLRAPVTPVSGTAPSGALDGRGISAGVLVNVQVTVTPAARLTALGGLPLSQDEPIWAQPEAGGTVSVTPL